MGIYEKEKEVIEYLKRKYEKNDEEFNIVGADYAGYTSLKDTYYIRTNGISEKRVVVECIDGSYKDNYLVLAFIKDYESWIQKIYDEKECKCKCICSDRVYPTDRFTIEDDFQKYIHSEYNQLKEVILTMSDIEKTVNIAIELMQKYDIPHKYILIKKINDLQVFERINSIMDLEEYEQSSTEIMDERLIKIRKTEVMTRGWVE